MNTAPISLRARAEQVAALVKAKDAAVAAQTELGVLLQESGRDLVRACAYEILAQYAFPPNCVPIEMEMDSRYGHATFQRDDTGEWAPPSQGEFRLRVGVPFPTAARWNGIPPIGVPDGLTVTVTLCVGLSPKRSNVAQVRRSILDGMQGVAAELQAALDVEVERKIYPGHVLLQAKQWPLVYPLAGDS